MEKNLKVLLVEDDLCLQTALRRSFKSMGGQIKVQWVTTADEALILLANQPYDLIIADFTLPGSANGFELWKNCKNRYPTTPFILMSGLLSTPDFLKLTEGTKVQLPFLSKPFMPEQFQEMVRSILFKSQTSATYKQAA